MKNPKISIIMSVYNGMTLGPQSKTGTASSAYLKEAVESILNQTYKNFEFIIVDDASTDKTWDYLKSLKDKRVRLLRNKQNLGLAASLNKALRLAQGDYVARMDADDISLPNRFEEQVEFLQRHPEIDLCGTWADLINEKSEIIGEKKYPKEDQSIRKVLPFYNPIIHPTWMVKKEVFLRVGDYNPNLDFAEDYDLLIRISKYFKMANLGKKLLKHRLWNQRRSQKEMAHMDKTELTMKIKHLKKNFSLILLMAVIKKMTMTYFIPAKLKVVLARYLKLA